MNKHVISRHATILVAFTIFTLLAGTFQISFPAVSAQIYERDQTLIVAHPKTYHDPTNFNIYVPGTGSRSGRGAHQLIFEYLFYSNYETGEFIPWLAERYEYSPDYKQITVYLRKGIKWSDGKPFTADDVVFTYNLLLKYAPKLIWSENVAHWVSRVEKVDDYTVKFYLKTANPRFHLIREAFAAVPCWGGITILPKHIWEGKDPLTFKFYPPVGTGPYKVVSVSEKVFVYERRDDWWVTEKFGVRPAPKYIIFQNFGPEDIVAERLIMNDIDCAQIGMLTLASFLKVREKNPYVKAWHATEPYAWLDPCPRFLFINNAKYPWSLPEVRKAISYLIDRDALIRIAYEGTTEPSSVLHPNYGGYKPYFDAIKDLIEKYEPAKYDPKKAEEIFKSLGFKKVDGIWTTPNGTKLEMTYLVDSGSSELMKVAAVLVDQLKAGGIAVSLRTLTGTAFSHASKAGDWDAMGFWICPGAPDPLGNLDALHSKHTRPLGEEVDWPDLNSFRYINKEYDAIVEELAITPPTNQEKCIELFRKAYEIFYKDLPVIPTTQAPALVPINTYYWTGWPDADNPWNMPVPWWATFLTVVAGYPTEKGEWVGGVRPRTVEYTTVYFTKSTPKFRGIDLVWYGPFSAGDAERIPTDDAEFWVKKGYASYKPIISAPKIPELATIAKSISALSSSVDELKSSVESVKASVAGISGTVTTLTVGIVIEAIAIIILAVALLRKRS